MMTIFRFESIQATVTKDLKNEKIELMESSKYIPINTYLTLYSYVDTNHLARYFESRIKREEKNKSYKKNINLRNDIFNLIGLDFNDDISKLIRSHYNFSIIDSEEDGSKKEWLLILEDSNLDETSDFLDIFLNNSSIDNIKTIQENYKGIQIVSLISKEKERISGALTNDKMLIISSKKSIIKNSLSIKNDSSKNQLSKRSLKKIIENFQTGIALMTASNEALGSLFNVPIEIIKNLENDSFIASVKSDDKRFYLDSYFEIKQEKSNVAHQTDGKILNNKEDASNILLETGVIDNNQNHNYSSEIDNQWLGKKIFNVLEEEKSSIAKEILEIEQGPSILIYDDKNWLLVSKDKNHLEKAEDILTKRNLNKNILPYKDKEISVWSSITTKTNQNDYTISNTIEIILMQDLNNILWSNDINSLQISNELAKGDKSLMKEWFQVGEQSALKPIQLISLSKKTTEKLLNQWKAWQLMQITLGKFYKPNHSGLDLLVIERTVLDKPTLNVKAELSID